MVTISTLIVKHLNKLTAYQGVKLPNNWGLNILKYSETYLSKKLIFHLWNLDSCLIKSDYKIAVSLKKNRVIKNNWINHPVLLKGDEIELVPLEKDI